MISRWEHIVRYSVVILGKKHVCAKAFKDRHEKYRFTEHITRVWKARII